MSEDVPVIREKHDGDSPEQSESVRLWLRLLSCTTIVEKRLRRRLAASFDTTLPRYDVLAALSRHPEGMSMGALSQSLLVSGGNLTSVVQQLRREALLDVVAVPDDRRLSIVMLTDMGRDHFETLCTAHRSWVEAMLAGLNDAQRTMLYDLLGTLKISIAMAERTGTETRPGKDRTQQ